MKRFTKEAKIGLAFIIAIFVLYYGISFLKGIDIFKSSSIYKVAFENVEGLAQSTPVTVKGFQVGVVSSMTLDKQSPDHVIVFLNMDKNIEIPKGSTFVMDVSMLGTASIELEYNHNTAELYTTEDLIHGSRKTGLMDSADDLAPGISNIIAKLDSTLTGLELLVNSPALKSSLENTELITANLANSSKQFNLLMNNLNRDVPVIMNDIKTLSKDFTEVSANVKKIDIETTFKSLETTMKNIEQVSKQVSADDNSLGLLLNDRQLYDSINQTVTNASKLLKDVKDNPSRYINVKVF